VQKEGALIFLQSGREKKIRRGGGRGKSKIKAHGLETISRGKGDIAVLEEIIPRATCIRYQTILQR